MKLQILWRDFDNLAMKDSETVQEFVSKVSEIINQIRSYGDNIVDKKVVEKVLRCLPEKFEHVVAAIEESKDLNTYTLDQLFGSLEAHEKRMSRFSSQPLEQAFKSNFNISEKGSTSSSNKKRGSFQRGRDNSTRGRGGKSNFGQRNFQGNANSKFYCIICKRNGHESKNCYFKCTKCKVPNHSQRDCWNKDKSRDNEANHSEEVEENQVFYSCMSVQQESKNTWYVDSACSSHMTGQRNLFVKLDEDFSSKVKLGWKIS